MENIKIVTINKKNEESVEMYKVADDETFTLTGFKKDYKEKNGVVPDKQDIVKLLVIDGEDVTEALKKWRKTEVLSFDDACKYLRNQMDCNKQSREKYQRENKDKSKSVAIRFMTGTESDLLEYLDTKRNKAGYIKDLIRADMERQKSACF